jgi:hypothetical protein
MLHFVALAPQRSITAFCLQVAIMVNRAEHLRYWRNYCRRILKVSLACAQHGASSPDVEATLVSLCGKIASSMSHAQCELRAVPTWLTDVYIRSCWDARAVAPREAEAAEPEAAEPVPAIDENLLPGLPPAAVQPEPPPEAALAQIDESMPTDDLMDAFNSLSARVQSHVRTRAAEQWGAKHKVLWEEPVRALLTKRSWKKKGWQKCKGHIVWGLWVDLDLPTHITYIKGVMRKRATLAETESSAVDDQAEVDAAVDAVDEPGDASDAIDHPVVHEEPSAVEEAIVTPTKTPKLQQSDLVRVGRNLSSITQRILEDDTTPYKVKDAAKRLITKACSDAGLSERRAKTFFGPAIIHKGYGRDDMPLHVPTGGRPKDSFRFPDSLLKQVLGKHTVPTARIGKNDEVINSLSGSVSGLFANNSEMSDLYSRRQWSRRTRGCRINVGKARGRTDDCDVCSTWDFTVSPTIRIDVNKFDAATKSLDPDYWKGTQWEDKGLDVSLLSEVQEWLEFVDRRWMTRPTQDEGELMPIEAHVLELFRERWLPIIEVFSMHFSAKWELRDLFATERLNTMIAESQSITMIWDHMDCSTLPKVPSTPFLGPVRYLPSKKDVGFPSWGPVRYPPPQKGSGFSILGPFPVVHLP